MERDVPGDPRKNWDQQVHWIPRDDRLNHVKLDRLGWYLHELHAFGRIRALSDHFADEESLLFEDSRVREWQVLKTRISR